MEDGGGRGGEKSLKRPHPTEDEDEVEFISFKKEKSHKRPHPTEDEDEVEFVSFKKEKKDPGLPKGPSSDEIKEDVVIVEETQGATGTSANDVKPLGKEDFIVTFFKPSDTIKYPHAREDCRVHKFLAVPSQLYGYGGNGKQENKASCDSCYCYVCDIPAKECQEWTRGDHCNAHSKDTSWKLKRKKTVADNSKKTARVAFSSHPSLRSSLSQEEREAEGMSTIHDSSLDEILSHIDSTYEEYSAYEDDEEEEEDDCYCYCHDDDPWRCEYEDEDEDDDDKDDPCYRCEGYHYGTRNSLHDYDPVKRALNSAVASARTHWQNKKPFEALIILEETMRSLCLHQPNEVTIDRFGETSDGGLVACKRLVMKSIEELLVDMFVDRSGILPSSLKEKAMSSIKRTFDLAPRDCGNIRPDIALGLKSWDDQELLAVLDGSYNPGQDKTTGSSIGNSTDEVIVVEDSPVDSRNSSFTEDYLVAKKRLQILESEKRWQGAVNYIHRVNIKSKQYGTESWLKNKLLTYLAHLGNWKEVHSELVKSENSNYQGKRPRLARMDPTDFLNIMKCFTTGQEIEMLPADSASASTPNPDVNLDEVFRIYLCALAQNSSLQYSEKCVSWFIAWTCQETLEEISLKKFQRYAKQAKSVIRTSKTRVTVSEDMTTLNNKVGRAVMATCWLASNWSSRDCIPVHNVSIVMEGFKNNLWLAVCLLIRLCDDLKLVKAYYNNRLSDVCHQVAKWIAGHEGLDLQCGHPGSIAMGKVLSQLPLVKAKEVLETILSAALTGNRMPEERIKVILQAKTVVSELTNNRELMGKVLVYMARVGKCTEVREELMKEKQDGTLRIRPLKAVSQIGDDDFLDIMKALTESVKKLWGADQLQATQYIENEIFTCCIHGLVWNDKVQQSLSFIAWFLELVCARKMEEPSDSLMKNLEHMAKSLRKAVDKSDAESIATRIEGKEGKAVAACILSLPGFKGTGYTYQQRMKNLLNTFKQNKWLLTFLLNQPDGPKGTVVADWIWENSPEILDKLTEDATTRLVSSVEKGSGYNILKGLVKSSGNKGIEKKRRIVQFAQCLLNQLQKYDRMSNDILAYIITKVDPIIRSMDDPSAKASLQQLYQKNFEFCPTMKSLEELKKVCSPEEWLDKKDSCLVYYINDIKSLPTCLTCLVLLMKSGSDHITELLSLPVTRETCNSFSSGADHFSPACPTVIKKIAAVLKEVPSAEETQFLQKAKSWLVAESWSSLLCAGRPCRNKVQPSMDILWKAIAEISPQELVNILRAAMKAVERKFNVITVTHFMRSAYVTWLLRVKDAFRLANQLVQFGRILNGTLRVLKRKKPLTHEVKASGLLLNLPDKESPQKQNPAMQNVKKGNGASPNVSKALKTLNISNKGSGTNKDDAATRLMKELIAKKPSPEADRCGSKHPATCVSANATPMELANSGNSVKKASRHSLSATSAQSTGKSANKYSYQTRSKDKSTAQSTGSCALAKTALSNTSSPLSIQAPAAETNSCALSASAGNAGGDQKGCNTGGDQKGGNTGGDQKGGSTGGDQKGGNTGGDQKGGNTGGDQKGGNTGGDQKGGNTGGDQKGGNTGGDQKGGNTGGDQKGGNTGGDQKGGNTGGDQKGGSPELTNIGSKILELTKTTGVDGAFQLIIGRMTGKVASSSPLAEDIVSNLLKLKGPINLKIGNNRLVINAQLAATSPVIPNVPPPQPAQAMPNARSVTTVPYVDPTTPIISQSAPQHMYGPTGPNLALRPILPRAPATGSVSTYVPGAVPTVPHSGSFTMPVVPTCSVAVQPTTHSTPVTGAISRASSSSTTNIQPTRGAHGQQQQH